MALRMAAAAAALFLLPGFLGGCGTLTHRFDSEPKSTAALPAVGPDSPLPSDDVALLSASARTAITDGRTEGPDWQNARSGASGTFSFVAPEDSGQAGTCRAFVSEVTSAAGVHAYRGDACGGPDDRTAIRNLRAVDQGASG